MHRAKSTHLFQANYKREKKQNQNAKYLILARCNHKIVSNVIQINGNVQNVDTLYWHT